MITRTLTANGSKGHHKFQLYVEESKTDTNNSYMSFNFKIMPIQTSWNWEQFGNITYSVKIGDNTYTGGIPNYDGYSTVTLKSGSNIKIPHNADGTKTINISFSVVDKSSARYTCGNASSSASLTLSMLHKPPIYSSYTLTENNSKLSGLGANTIVTNMSNTTIKTNWTLYDGATINSIEVFNANGTKISPSNSISGASVTSTFNFRSIAVPTSGGKTSFKFRITDSMGASCEYTISNINVIVYNEPRIIPTQTSVKRNGQLTGKVTLNLKGTFSNKTIANTTNNITMQFKYWRSGTTEPSTYFDIPSNVISKSGDNVSINKWNMAKSGTIISDVNRDYNYKFKIRISDSFGYVNIVELTCPKGMWIMCRFKDRVDFNKITVKGKDFVPETIWTGALQGSQSITLNNVKRYLDVYVKFTSGSASFLLKYTIDTTLNILCYGGGISTDFDQGNITDNKVERWAYFSEARYDTRNNEFRHTKSGFIWLGKGTFESRIGTQYIIYQIDTHD